MALRLRGGKDVKKSSYYVWYLGAKEAKAIDAMPGAMDYLLERERLQEPFKVTLQVSGKGLKIIQTVHPGGSTKSAVKHLVPSHAILATIQREDVVAVTLLLPNPASNNPVHVHAYRCDSVETAELLGGQLKILASYSDNIARVPLLENRTRSNVGSDGRSTRESESSEGSGELRHVPIQTTTIYESLAAELRAKLGRTTTDTGTGPILLPPRDYDTVHRTRGNLTGIELRRCLNQTIVGNVGVDRGGSRSAASSGIGSDSAATPPPVFYHHPLLSQSIRPSRDSSSDDDWGPSGIEPNYGPERSGSNLTLPRITRSPERAQKESGRNVPSASPQKVKRTPELRQRSPSPQYRPRVDPNEISSPRERFQDAKEMFRAMEQEATTRPAVARQRNPEVHVHRMENSRQLSENRINHHVSASSLALNHPNSHHVEITNREIKALLPMKPKAKYNSAMENYREPEMTRPRSFYEAPPMARELRGPRNIVDPRNEKGFRNSMEAHSRDKMRNRPVMYQELPEHNRYPGLDRENARAPLEMVQTPSRYRHSYAEPRLGFAALHPY